MTSFNLSELFEIAAGAVPEREAIVHGDVRLTYAEVDERAGRLAAVLATNGVRAGDHIGLHLYNGPEYLEAMLAAFKLRAVPINVNYRYVAHELRHLFADADVVAVVHEPELGPVIASARPKGLRFTLVRGKEYETAIASADEPLAVGAARSGDDRYVLYTGGTTGPPKGVVWRHEDVFFAALGGGGEPPITRPGELAERARRGRGRLLPASPFIHGSAHWMALSTLFRGGTVVIDSTPAFDPRSVWDTVEAEGVGFLVIVGDAFARPLVDAIDREPSRWDLSPLTVVLSGGAILSPAVKDALLARLPGCIVVDGFGASETGGQGQMVAVAGASGTNPRFAMDDTTAVLDPDLRTVEPGSGRVGRVARRGRIPLGYYKDDVKTAEMFPTVDGVRWALLGDLATVELDGMITVFGRGAASINTGGEKVHAEEVEAALKGHASVFDAVVVGVPDDRWGERVSAVVQLRRNTPAPTVEELADHARSTLAGYKVPRSMVVVDEIVRSPSGKADYQWAAKVARAASRP